jgi:hypothetical protein
VTAVAQVSPVHITPRNPEVLDRRARALAAGTGEAAGPAADDLVSVVLFKLHGLSCAVDMSAVARAVSRLDRVVSVPIVGGGERFVAFVEERPFPVVDLIGMGGQGRQPERLAQAPALILTFENGSVAVAVEGPLELAEEPLVQLAEVSGDASSDPNSPRIRGRLPSGATLFDADWMLSWAAAAIT